MLGLAPGALVSYGRYLVAHNRVTWHNVGGARRRNQRPQALRGSKFIAAALLKLSRGRRNLYQRFALYSALDKFWRALADAEQRCGPHGSQRWSSASHLRPTRL